MPEATLEEVRAEIDVLQAIMHVCGEARIPAKEHVMAGKVLTYVDGLLKGAEARLAPLLPPVLPTEPPYDPGAPIPLPVL